MNHLQSQMNYKLILPMFHYLVEEVLGLSTNLVK